MKKSLFSTVLLASAVSSLILAGCGSKTPGTTANPYRNRAPLQGGMPLQQPTGTPGAVAPGTGLPGAAAPGGAAADAAGRQLLEQVKQAQQTQQGFTATVETFEKGPKDQEGQTLKVAWKRPSILNITIVKASGSSKDARVLWEGGDQMKVKPSWMPFSIGIAIKDERVVSKNGWNIRETDVSCILNVLLDPSTQVKFAGDQVVDNKQVAMLEVHSPKSPKGVTHELIGIDRQLNLPGVRLMFKGQTLSYKLVVRNMKLGVPSVTDLKI